jgi:hypothetical protein
MLFMASQEHQPGAGSSGDPITAESHETNIGEMPAAELEAVSGGLEVSYCAFGIARSSAVTAA